MARERAPPTIREHAATAAAPTGGCSRGNNSTTVVLALALFALQSVVLLTRAQRGVWCAGARFGAHSGCTLQAHCSAKANTRAELRAA
jgi:hypothetical protein